MNVFKRIFNYITRPSKICKNCRHWTLVEHHVYSSSDGTCAKSNSYDLVCDNYVCGKFEYCRELLQNTSDLKVLQFKKKNEVEND